jgi:hypothetical protein
MAQQGAASTGYPLVDAVLERHAGALGADCAAYSGYVACSGSTGRSLQATTRRRQCRSREPSPSALPGRQSAASVRLTSTSASIGA